MTPLPPLTPAPDLTTKEGWREFVYTPVSQGPPLPTKAKFRTMDPSQRAAFDLLRISHIARLGPIVTPAMQAMHTQMHRQVVLNSHHSGAGRGTVISGPGGVGKTTIITQFGKRLQLRLNQAYAAELTADHGEYIPVVFVTVSSEATPKGLNELIARFYNLPRASWRNKDHLTDAIGEVARACRTTLFLIDDIHFLDHSRKDHKRVNDHLKALANTISATFFYAGIDVERYGLLNEGGNPGSSQTGARFSLLTVKPFAIDTDAERREWAALLAAIERELPLFGACEGMLSRKLAAYVFNRTGGFICSVSQLVREGALLAIEGGKEVLTTSLLDEIVLDYVAEQRRPRKRRSARSPARAA